MIEQTELDGQSATVVYLTSTFEPCDKQQAKLVKVIFDDGRHMWLTPSNDKSVPLAAQESDTK